MSGKRAAGLIGDRYGDDDGEALVQRFLEIFDRVEAGLEVERVEDRLGQEQIDAAFDEGFDLCVVGFVKLVVAGRTVFRAIDIRRHGASTVGRADGTGHKRGTAFLRGDLVGHLARQLGGLDIDVAHAVLQAVVGLCDGGA